MSLHASIRSIKLLRKPPLLYKQICEGLKYDLRELGEIPRNGTLEDLLSDKEISAYQDMLMTNVAFSV